MTHGEVRTKPARILQKSPWKIFSSNAMMLESRDHLSARNFSLRTLFGVLEDLLLFGGPLLACTCNKTLLKPVQFTCGCFTLCVSP